MNRVLVTKILCCLVTGNKFWELYEAESLGYQIVLTSVILFTSS